MSYRCEMCGAAQPNGFAPVKKVMESRKVLYPPTKDRNGYAKTPRGHETVKELNCCNECASRIKEHRIIE